MALTEEQKKIINCVIEGMTNIEIAELMGYCPDTIKMRLRKLYRTYNVQGRVGLVKRMLLNG